jgi:D-alanine-D-alanine ligase
MEQRLENERAVVRAGVLRKHLDPAKTAARVRAVALAAFRALDLYGLSRLDFFLHKKTGAVYFNEPNTLPGFTPASMYPRLWRESGLPTRKLVETLIALALRRAAARRKISTTR